MKNQIFRYVGILLFVILGIMLTILIYINFFKKEDNNYATLREKGEGEILYLNSTIIELLNKVNNISYNRYDVTMEQVNQSQQQANSNLETNKNVDSKEPSETQTAPTDTGSATEATNQSESRTSKLSKTDSIINADHNNVPWDEISFGIETLYTAWPTINIDLKSLNVQEQDLSNFSVTLDGVAKSIKNKDKSNTLINLYNLYAMLPKFLSYFIANDAKINIYNTKAYILNAYVLVEKDKWEDVNNSINQAINSLNSTINSGLLYDSEKITFDKTLVLLQELQRGVELGDKEIFYLKYKLAMEQLEII